MALSSAPVSHDSHRNSTHATVAGWAACPGCASVGLCPPVTLTTTGGTAALGVLQQLGGATGPGRVPLLQSQPSCLILGKGAQVLCVAPIHLGEKEQAGVLGRLLPQPLHPMGKLSQGNSGHTGVAWQVREQARHPKAKGWRRLWECPAALQGVGRCQVDKVSVDRW